MKLLLTLDLAMQIERAFSHCYSQMSVNFPHDDLDREFSILAQEELVHSSLIKTGKSYALKVPEAFGPESDFHGDMQQGLSQIEELQQDLVNNSVALKQALQRMHALEARYEKVHMDSLADIKDDSLRQLFTALSTGDKAHRERLERIIQRVG